MTEEQIKQNADAYADKLYEDGRCTESTAPTIQEIYIAGAHSRDEEIKELKGQVTLHKERADYYHDLYMKLRNPWISIEDMLPAEFKTVIVMFDSGIIINAFVTMVKDEPAWHPSVEIPIGSDVIFWMQIPELKKGELK